MLRCTAVTSLHLTKARRHLTTNEFAISREEGGCHAPEIYRGYHLNMSFIETCAIQARVYPHYIAISMLDKQHLIQYIATSGLRELIPFRRKVGCEVFLFIGIHKTLYKQGMDNGFGFFNRKIHTFCQHHGFQISWRPGIFPLVGQARQQVFFLVIEFHMTSISH